MKGEYYACSSYQFWHQCFARRFLSGATELAPNFASLPGLVSKHWLGDEDNKIYGLFTR